MLAYLSLLKEVRYNGVRKEPARAGMPCTFELNTCQLSFDLEKMFPLLTTKKVAVKTMLTELCWFLRGDTNIKFLWDNECHIWDADAFKFFNRMFPNTKTKEEWEEGVKEGLTLGVHKYGDCGNIYGKQWRRFEGSHSTPFDQVSNLIDNIKSNPNSRYHIVTAWNPQDFLQYNVEAALPACHSFFQCFVVNGRLDLTVYQRSCDLFLGVPFNLASYATLTKLIAYLTGLRPGFLNWIGGSVHIYEDHLDAVNEQLSRIPSGFPDIKIDSEKIANLGSTTSEILDNITPDCFRVVGYEPQPAIRANLSVGI